jgi:hypothetical protein
MGTNFKLKLSKCLLSDDKNLGGRTQIEQLG